MAIRIIEGVIGSGKTYYAVRHIAKSYFEFNTDLQIYQPKDNSLIVYSNIDRFALSQPLEPLIQEAGGLTKFFDIDYQKRLISNNKVVYVIDEAQGPAFFHRKFYNPQVFYFFQFHRHLGIDIYLITQDVTSLARELRDLAEYHIKAARRTHSLAGEFRYHFMSGDDSWKVQALRPEKQYFSLYKSMQAAEVEKIGSATRRQFTILALLVVVIVIFFYYGFLGMVLPKGKSVSVIPSARAQTPQQKQSIVQPLFDNSSKSDPVFVKTGSGSVSDSDNELLTDITITGLVWLSNTEGLITFTTDKKEYKMSVFEFDRLCKCSTVNKLKSGDSLTVVIPSNLPYNNISSSSVVSSSF